MREKRKNEETDEARRKEKLGKVEEKKNGNTKNKTGRKKKQMQ